MRTETVGEALERLAAQVGRRPKAELDTIHLRLAGSPAVTLPVAVNLRGH